MSVEESVLGVESFICIKGGAGFYNVLTRGHILKNKLKGNQETAKKMLCGIFLILKTCIQKPAREKPFNNSECKLCCSPNGRLKLHKQTHPGDEHCSVLNVG